MALSINYSIIIPHKNIPELLQKCLDSMPKRDDVQIIVVDDNSDEDKVDFEHFPGLNEERTEVYLTKEGKGAGYARNVGLQHAIGKWVVFADADDYFLPIIEQSMNIYQNSDVDVIYFKRDRLELDNTISYAVTNEYIDYARETGDYSRIKFWMTVPVAKFIKLAFIHEYNINFEEIRWSNDVMFATKIGVEAKKIELSNDCIYRVVTRNGSLRRKNTLESNIVRLLADCRSFNLLKERGLYNEIKPVVISTMQYWINIFYKNKKEAIKLIPTVINAMDFKSFCHIIYRNKKKILRSILNYE